MKKSEQFEIKLYEHLGVKQFRKMVFLLEKLIHIKDKGKNVNYHVKENNLDELNNFKKFLYYNGTIHVRNAIGVTALILIQPLLFSKWTLLYLVPSLIKNIYCVMLQRYNYIKINDVIERKTARINKKIERKKESFEDALETKKVIINDKDKSIEQIDNIKKFLQGESDVFLDRESVETLHLIRNFIKEDYDKENKTEEKSEPYVKKIGGVYNGKR